MFEAAEVMGLYAETPLHPGTGSSTGVIDLPVQRERHTDFPIIQAFSIKGVLRDESERKLAKNPADFAKIVEVFGPELKQGDNHGGALSPTDARILLFPVRSLEGIFVWVTCPLAVARLKRDLTLVKKANGIPAFDHDPFETKVGKNCKLRSPLILEDQEYPFQPDERVDALADEIKKVMPQPDASNGYRLFVGRLGSHFAVIPDDEFSSLVKSGTDVVTRIKLNERKTTTGGGGNMWVEEFLPSESVFYSLLLAMSSRKKPAAAGGSAMTDQQVLDFIKTKVKPEVIQIGGDETVGRGWMRVTFLR